MSTHEQISQELNTAIRAIAAALDSQQGPVITMPAVMVGAGFGVLVRHIADLHERIEQLEKKA